MRNMVMALALGVAALPSVAAAQVAQPQMPPIVGTRLDVSATGETTRIPDVAIISAGVVTRAQTAGAAIQENSARMDRVTQLDDGDQQVSRSRRCSRITVLVAWQHCR